MVLRFHEDSWQVLRTDHRGLFSISGLWAETTILELMLKGYVPIHLPNWVIPGDGAQIELVMTPGRAVQLRIEDRSGGAVPAKHVKVAVEGYREFEVEGPRNGSYTVRDLPDAQITLSARVGGRTYTLEHDSTIAEASLLIPDSGAVEVDVPYELRGKLRLCLIPKQSEIRPTRTRVPAGMFSFDWLFPGEYLVCVQELVGGKGRVWKDRIDPIPVAVRSGETQRVKLANLLPG